MLRFARNDGGALILLGFAVFAVPSRAAETPPVLADHRPEAPLAETLSLQQFANDFPQCQEWSDGCSTCKRTDAVHCSTPGILCQPGVISCAVP